MRSEIVRFNLAICPLIRSGQSKLSIRIIVFKKGNHKQTQSQ